MNIQIKRAETSAQWFHYDVMDGVFVDNIVLVRNTQTNHRNNR